MRKMSLSFSIDTQKLDSGDKARDIKIAKIFFGGMRNGQMISGSVESIKKDFAKVKVKMNDVEKHVELKLVSSGKKVTATGFIDVLDFAGLPAVKALNQACFEKHEGKTWSDAGVELVYQCL